MILLNLLNLILIMKYILLNGNSISNYRIPTIIKVKITTQSSGVNLNIVT